MSAIGINWNFKYREQIKTLKDKVDKLYRENQRMKKRLEKHEGSRAMVYYYNNEK
jgi:hypothetical protein